DSNRQPARTTDRSYTDFDDPQFALLYVEPAEDGRVAIDLYLEGVHCTACVWLVERLPAFFDGVYRCRLDLGRQLARVEYDPKRIKLSTIARQLDLHRGDASAFVGEQLLEFLQHVALLDRDGCRILTVEQHVVLEHALGNVEALADRGNDLLGLAQRRAVEVEAGTVGRHRVDLLLLGLQRTDLVLQRLAFGPDGKQLLLRGIDRLRLPFHEGPLGLQDRRVVDEGVLGPLQVDVDPTAGTEVRGQ
ncbi:MAG: cation transporter, partial [Planctomycetes bacterium]|nr:cation transporter [Planctomycetota bacterium]